MIVPEKAVVAWKFPTKRDGDKSYLLPTGRYITHEVGGRRFEIHFKGRLRKIRETRLWQVSISGRQAHTVIFSPAPPEARPNCDGFRLKDGALELGLFKKPPQRSMSGRERRANTHFFSEARA